MVCVSLTPVRPCVYLFLPVLILGVCLGYILLSDRIYIIQTMTRPPQPVISFMAANNTEFKQMHQTYDVRYISSNQTRKRIYMVESETRNTSLESTSRKEDLFNWYDLVVTEWVNHTLVRRTSPDNFSRHLFMVVESRGRLGNQMFIYAVLFGMSILYPERTPCLIRNVSMNMGFKQIIEAFPYLTIHYHTFCKHPFNEKGVFIFRENKTDHTPAFDFIETPPNNHIQLRGFYQSFWFFNHVKNDIRREFQFSKDTMKRTQIFFQSIVPQEWNEVNFTRVGIHVRRGDRVTERMDSRGFIQPPIEFFYNAMNYFLERHERVQFIIASDDIPWCKKHLKAEHIFYSGQRYTIDMAIMSSCDHVVITLGSFSWWVGWLNKGTTIYHVKFPPPGTWASFQHRRENWYPPDDHYNHWVPLL